MTAAALGSSRSRWLFSPRGDLGLLIGPAVAATAVALWLPVGTAVSPAAWLALVVGVDVAHVYASLHRTYLHPLERRRRARLLIGAPLAALGGASALCLVSTGLFWRVLAYVAVWHFIKQQVGFAALYRVRAGLPTRSRAARLERAALWALCLGPVVWWHAHLPRRFAWFVEGDFVAGLPGWAGDAALAIAGVVVLAHVAVRLRSGEPPGGRDLWVATTGGVWVGGIVLTDSDLGFTATNVVLHGVPYMALVAWVGSREGSAPRGGSWIAAGIGFVVPLLALALLEEGAWDALVWHDHEALFGAWGPPAWLAALAVPVLAVPQITHYLLDGAIWKLGPGQERLRQAITGPRGSAPPSTLPSR